MKIVVKIGTSTLTYETGHLNIRRTRDVCRVLSDLKNAGHQIVLVSSGAIAMGVGKLGLTTRPRDIPTKQAAAAVGQCELMDTYDRMFSEYRHTVAQVLLTGEDLRDKTRHENFRNTMGRLLDLQALPVINENDSVATDEIGVGDNDTLSALVAESIGADLLILLSDIDGLYTADPRQDPEARLIERVDTLSDDILALGGGAGSARGTGGMKTKLAAAQICRRAGCDMLIANGDEPARLYGLVDGSDTHCTRFRFGGKV